MRGVYEAVHKISTVTAAKTLMYLTVPADKVVEILSAEVTANGETNEQIEVALQRIGTLGTPTGTAVTPAKTEAGDQAASSTVVGNVTASEPTYTASTVIGQQSAASLGGYRFQPVPEERPIVGGQASIGIRLLQAITSNDLTVVLRFREIG